jgi:hypothetical protein
LSTANRKILGKDPKKALAALLILIFARSASADVTITERSGSRASSPQTDRVRRIMIKGLKMRIESQSDKKLFVTVYDLDAGQETVWEANGKTASVFDLSAESGKHKKEMKTVKSSILPTGQKGQVLGASCEMFKYEVEVAPPSVPRFLNSLTGTLCVSSDIPGSRDFAQFAEAAKTRGYFLGATSDFVNPRSALFSAIADLNALVLERTERWEMLGGPGVGFYGTEASNEVYSVLTDITNEPISDDLFRVPDGRKIKKDRTMGSSIPIGLNTDQTRSVLARAGSATKN